MSDPVETLETKRKALLAKLAQTGDMRRGSITEVYRPCGKRGCCCTGPDHPGHGPYYAYTRKVGGRTKSLQLRAGPRLSKIEREVGNYRQFRVLTEQLLQVNEALCQARPVEEPSERMVQKKTLRGSSARRSRRK